MSRVTKANPTASTLGQSTAGLALRSGASSQSERGEKRHHRDPGARPVHRRIQTVAWATLHWNLRACSRIRKGRSRVRVRVKWGASTAWSVSRVLTGRPSCSKPPSQCDASGVVLEPGTGRRHDQLSSRTHEVGEAVQASAGFAEAIHQVSQQHHVERAQVRTQVLRIALLERHPVAVDLGGHHRRRGRGQVAFLDVGVGDRAMLLQVPRDLDEAMGVVDADDLGAVPRQLERGSSDGATEVQRARLGRQTRDLQTLGDATRRVVEGGRRAERPGQNLLRRSVVEEQVFRERPFRFVESLGGQRPLTTLPSACTVRG